jgi:hypothetical protein
MVVVMMSRGRRVVNGLTVGLLLLAEKGLLIHGDLGSFGGILVSH